MNTGIITTVVLFILMQVLDPTGVLSTDVQVGICALAYIGILWAKTKVDEFNQAHEGQLPCAKAEAKA